MLYSLELIDKSHHLFLREIGILPSQFDGLHGGRVLERESDERTRREPRVQDWTADERALKYIGLIVSVRQKQVADTSLGMMRSSIGPLGAN